ncbi:MAG: FecCD family ABC transporter permease [Acidimicrobiales bacterium]
MIDIPVRSTSATEALQTSTARAFRLPRLATPISICLLSAALLLAVSFGSSDISFRAILTELIDAVPGISVESGLTDSQRSILWQWRAPRAVLGALVGSSLALGGATYQGVFRNPLADPYLLGVAAGAGLGATVAIVSGVDYGWGPIHSVPLAAFIGGLLAIAVSAGVGFGVSRGPAALLLAGVAVASFLTAAQTYVMQRNTDILAEVYSWILGRLGTFGWTEVTLLLPYVVVCSGVILLLRRQLDVLQLGDDEALALGVPVLRVRIILILAASLLAAAAVAVSGLISFVGIIVPHVVRLLVGSNYRIVLPMSAIGGATFLVLADVGARNLTGGAELPIGVVTAFFGAPFFAFVMWSRRGTFG